MEVALMALGVGLIMASFEIHYRYLEIAKLYYKKQLDSISVKLEDFIINKKPSEKNQGQLSQFFKDLNNILSDFSIERDRANFPSYLLYGFLSLGAYIIFIGFFYESILFIYNNPPTPGSNMDGMIIMIIIFAMLPGALILRGLKALRKITRIV